jgi:hypothetical protein
MLEYLFQLVDFLLAAHFFLSSLVVCHVFYLVYFSFIYVLFPLASLAQNFHLILDPLLQYDFFQILQKINSILPAIITHLHFFLKTVEDKMGFEVRNFSATRAHEFQKKGESDDDHYSKV